MGFNDEETLPYKGDPTKTNSAKMKDTGFNAGHEVHQSKAKRTVQSSGGSGHSQLNDRDSTVDMGKAKDGCS